MTQPTTKTKYLVQCLQNGYTIWQDFSQPVDDRIEAIAFLVETRQDQDPRVAQFRLVERVCTDTVFEV